MTDEKQNEKNNDLARRDFVALSVAAGITAAAAGSALAKDLEVVETMVEVKTPDGTADAAFIHPASGSHPGVLIWTDAFGLRPSMRAISARICAMSADVFSSMTCEPSNMSPYSSMSVSRAPICCRRNDHC